MALNISLIGNEAKQHVLSVLAAMHAYVHGPAPALAPVAAPIDPQGPSTTQQGGFLERTPADIEAAETTKKAAASAKKAAAKKASDEAATIDALDALAASAAADTSLAEQPTARDYAVEELRALAGELNVDATRAQTIEVLTGVGAKSVTALKDMTAEVRCTVFDKLTAILEAAKAAEAALN